MNSVVIKNTPMKKIAIISAIHVTALLTSSCVFDINFGDGKKGNGVIVTESRDVTADFSTVSASEGLDVFVTQADDFKIKVEADENVIKLIGTEIKDGKLKIHAIENIGRATKKIFVSLPNIEMLESSSGADLIGKSNIKADAISLRASSGSDLKVSIMANEITADASSGADIRISGETDVLNTSASSGSDIRAKNLLANTCYANASSGSDINVNVSKLLVADASSGSDISYSGDPKVEKNNSVSGDIRKN